MQSRVHDRKQTIFIMKETALKAAEEKMLESIMRIYTESYEAEREN